MPAKRRIESLVKIRDFIDRHSKIITPDALFLGELLFQTMTRLDGMVYIWESQQHILARAEPVTISTTETSIFNNTFPYPVTVVIYNLDPAQTCFIGGGGLTVNDSLPIFPESSERYTIEAGREVFGRVAAGTIDIRFYTTMKRMII